MPDKKLPLDLNAHGTLLIQSGRLLTSTRDQVCDLLIEEGRVKAIDSPGSIPAASASAQINAKDLWVVPGLIDAHVHLREPGLEYKETIATGTLSAVAGGFTSVACMANTQPINDSPYVTAYIRERARSTAYCRVFPIGAVTKGLQGETLAEIGGMVEEGAVAISDDGLPVMNSYLMRKAMDYAKAFDIPVITHSEDLNLVAGAPMNEGALSNELGLRGNPSAAEEIMVAREIALCRLTGCHVHIAHVSTKEAVALIRRAKAEGLKITSEVTPHHLSLTEECVRTYDTHCKMAPPLRSKEDTEALIEGLADGTIDIIATDHAPHASVDKETEFALASFGIIGVQSAVPVTLDLVRKKQLSPKRWVEAWTSQPAQILGLDLGKLDIGSMGDITLVDPKKSWTFNEEQNLSKAKNSPWMNQTFQGKAVKTIIAGKVIYES